jgi:hypothetical protein
MTFLILAISLLAAKFPDTEVARRGVWVGARDSPDHVRIGGPGCAGALMSAR